MSFQPGRVKVLRTCAAAVFVPVFVLLLAGCATPLPSAPPMADRPLLPPRSAPAPVSVLVVPPVPAASAVLVPTAPPVAPEPNTIAARFPAPAVRYTSTPGLQEGRTEFTTSGELQALLRELTRPATSATPHATLLSLGSSQAGLPIEALLLTRQPDASPAALLRSGAPTVLLVGQQHGDEPASAEALLVIAHELLRGRLQELLDRVNVIVVPRANPDGAARQQRLTATGIDANRDHLLLRTPEAQAQARLMREYQPLVVVDAHEYPVLGPFVDAFGALPRHDVLTQYAMTAQVHPFVSKAAEEWFRQPMVAALKQQGLSVEWYHTASVEPANKRLAMGGPQPDVARNAHGLRHAVSLLLETRGVGLGRQHLQRRVHSQVTAIGVVLKQAAAHAADLRKLRQYVEAEVAAQACQGQVVVEAALTPTEYTLTMLDARTGEDKPVLVNWDSALVLNELRSRARPCGYWLAGDQADAVMKLRALGLRVMQLAETGVLQGESFSAVRAADGVVWPASLSRVPTLLDAPAGSYYVPLSQPLANLAVAALEPDTPFSFASNGVVSNIDRQARVLGLPEVRMLALP